jgi:transcription factor C subunit 7
LHASGKDVKIHTERGVGEFYGLARFDHPSPAPFPVLQTHFDHLVESEPTIVPSTKGESIAQLHDRIAYALSHLIVRADDDLSEPKTMLICTHAAGMIAIGRALTGKMPEDETEDDFNCFTCSFSKFVRRPVSKYTGTAHSRLADAKWDPETPEKVPDVEWRGFGVGGGWDCEINGDCSFLEGGEERGW